MATRVEDHLAQWAHNRKFLEHIDPEYPDWIVTVSFYTALHIVDALLLSDNIRVTSHDSRNRALSQNNRYKKINIHYYPMYELSRTIRYLANHGTWVPFNKIESEVFKRFLYPTEKSATALANLNIQRPDIKLRVPGPAR